MMLSKILYASKKPRFKLFFAYPLRLALVLLNPMIGIG